jgi:hypothetical protein
MVSDRKIMPQISLAKVIPLDQVGDEPVGG